MGSIGTIASTIVGMGAADKAADAQRYAADQGITEQRERYEEASDILSPYTGVGADAIEAQRAFLGLGDPDAYQQQIDIVTQSPAFQEALRQGEEAILQNAAATGGLRGGNTQRALMQFRPQLLAQMLDQQYERLGGLTSFGLPAAQQQAGQAQQLGRDIAGLRVGQGNAAAQGYLGRAFALRQGVSDINKQAAMAAGAAGGGAGAGAGGFF